MSLREAVEDVIESAMIDGWHSMEPETSLWRRNVEQQARAAIIAMREALLQPEVVEAAAKAAQGEVLGAEEFEDDDSFHEMWVGYVKAALTAALAAMTDAGRKKKEHATISKARMVEIKRAYREARGLS